jgi:hypothetical protein
MMRLTSLPVTLIALFFLTTAFAQESRYGEFNKDFRVPTNKLLRVNIDIDAAKFKLRKITGTAEARVSMLYSEHDFRADADFDEKRNRIEILFSKKSWWDSSDNHSHAEVLVELPAGVEIDLDSEITAGEIDIDFGGLKLVALNLTTLAGEVLVDFSEPNETVMEFLRINTRVGETELVRLGNARFKEAEINGGIGEMRVDFSGALNPEASAYVDLDLGETHLYLPEEVGIKLSVSKFLFLSHIDLPYDFEKSGRYYFSSNYDRSAGELFVKVSPGLGELRVDYQRKWSESK